MAGRSAPFHFLLDILRQTSLAIEDYGIARGAILGGGGFNQIQWLVALLPFIFCLTSLGKQVWQLKIMGLRGARSLEGGFNQIQWLVALLPFIFCLTSLGKQVWQLKIMGLRGARSLEGRLQPNSMAGRCAPFHFLFDILRQTSLAIEDYGIARGAILGGEASTKFNGRSLRSLSFFVGHP
jgi:hypothetical protein